MRNLVAGCWLVPLLGAVPSVQADNTACASAVFVIPDGSVHEGDFTAVPQDRWFRFVARANRSYALVAENLAPTDDQQFVDMAAPFPSCGGVPFTDVEQTFNGYQEPRSFDASGNFGSERRSLALVADSGVFVRVIRLAGGTAGPFRFRVEETTIYNPAWSTIGPFNTFYSFQNTTNAAIRGTLTLLDTSGAVVDTRFAGIIPRSTFSVNTSDMATTRNQAGVAIFTHNGPPGSILCDASIASFSASPPYIQSVKCQTSRQER